MERIRARVEGFCSGTCAQLDEPILVAVVVLAAGIGFWPYTAATLATLLACGRPRSESLSGPTAGKRALRAGLDCIPAVDFLLTRA
jgi:hypothetical protein